MLPWSASYCLQDPFWRFVAKATKDKPVEEVDDWPGVAKNLTFDFLMTDSESILSCRRPCASMQL